MKYTAFSLALLLAVVDAGTNKTQAPTGGGRRETISPSAQPITPSPTETPTLIPTPEPTPPPTLSPETPFPTETPPPTPFPTPPPTPEPTPQPVCFTCRVSFPSTVQWHSLIF
mmetsp:Transcript_1344/g.2615  ORF Transcript_1344/g.2615 Transcript_1344/m.2615 type:complete len:113 (-) Transcript_1344:37-375(-)